MIEGLIDHEQITRSRISSKAAKFEFTTIPKDKFESYRQEGWEIVQTNKRTFRLKKLKRHDVAFEDSVWAMLARMGFTKLNSDRNFRLKYSKSEEIPGKQIDVFASDGETALVIECKSSEERRKISFQKDIAEIGNIKEGVIKTLRKEFGAKLKIAWIFATYNCIVSPNDKARIEDNKLTHFNQDDLAYFNNLVGHLGVVAKYQLLGLLFKGLEIPELKNKIPAVRGKMGGYTYYSFSVEPETLLKIGFVLHRTDTSKEAFDSYQRMVKRPRVLSINKYINSGGYFPNNIIINIHSKKRLQYDLATSTDHDSISEIGVLHLPKKYHSAFIIDGQHRLYGYGNTEWKNKNTIPVVAFENLPAKDQTEIFVDINHEQKSVPKNLLRTLMAEFNWGAEQPDVAIDALKTKLIHRLSNTDSSPLYKRIVTSEEKKSEIRCLNLDYLTRYGLNKTSMFGVVHKKILVRLGYLWAGDYEKTLDKSYEVLQFCFEYIASKTEEQWKVGSGEGGFIAMNIGIATSIRIIDEVITFLIRIDDFEPEKCSSQDIATKTIIYLKPVVEFINSRTPEELKKLRGHLGGGGVDKVIREFQYSIHKTNDSFNPEGLEKWIRDNSGMFNNPSKLLGDEIQLAIRNFVFSKLKEHLGEKNWWTQGIHKKIQTYCATAQIEEGHTEPIDHYLLTLHYQQIVKDNKEILLEYFTPPTSKSAGIDKRLSWFAQFNKIRKKFSHPERDKVTEEEFEFLNELKTWLFGNLGMDNNKS